VPAVVIECDRTSQRATSISRVCVAPSDCQTHLIPEGTELGYFGSHDFTFGCQTTSVRGGIDLESSADAPQSILNDVLNLRRSRNFSVAAFTHVDRAGLGSSDGAVQRLAI
jgi:hypothetical protein